MIAYINGKFIEEDKVKISPFDRGFLFADSIYEVIRTYNKKIFKIDEHFKRLEFSLKAVRINININSIKENIDELISRNKMNSDFNIYVQITRGVSLPRMHAFPPKEINPTIFIMLYPIIYFPREDENGIKVRLENDIRWTRCDIKSTSLLPAVLAHQSARDNGAYEAVFIRDGFITEGSHTNFFAVKNNIVYTPPLSNFILSGITREVVLEICRNISIETKETNIEEKELKSYNEFFITGTTTEIKPVVSFDDWLVENGKPGIITKKIQYAFKEYTSNY